MTFINNLETAFNNAAAVAKEDIVKFANEFTPILENDILNDLEALATIALGAVLQQAPLVISGAEKFGSAVASTIQTVEAQGKVIATGTAQMAVQQAYLTASNVAQGK